MLTFFLFVLLAFPSPTCVCCLALPCLQISSLFRLKFGGYVRPLRPEPLEVLAVELNDLDFCYAVLNKVSRSFAVVIQQLPKQLQDPVCIFYLVLRGLDSVEDDMTFDVEKKVPLLQTFYQKLSEKDWSISGVGDSDDYRVLLKHFAKVLRVYCGLDQAFQAVIADITRRMGEGMAEYATKTTSIDTLDSYNLYCHYVAGLVGHGLSDLFVASGLEGPELIAPHNQRLSNNMGLFLQKTNIIRDYLEDLQEGRTWWPKEVWSAYGEDLGDFARAPKAPRSLAALNHMVTDALSLVPDSLAYLGMIRDQKIFEFCAIPQVMAMATLELCYNNARILSSPTPVKIRKGLSCKLMLHASSIQQVHAWFYAFAGRLESRIPKDDPSAQRTRQLVATTKAITLAQVSRLALGPRRLGSRALRTATLAAWGVLIASSVYAATRTTLLASAASASPAASSSSSSSSSAAASSSSSSSLSLLSRGSDQVARLLARPAIETALATGSVLSLGFLGGFFGMQYV